MPSLIRSERQTLRAIQQHILALKTRAGGAYTQISTVGALFHPNTAQPDLNLVTPHQGVAWTRNDDLNEAFDLLESRGRKARLQYLRGLFPEAFERQLALYGLHRETQTPIWVYAPIEGPFPPDEIPFGRIQHQGFDLDDFSVEIATTREQTADWLRIYRSAAYGVDLPGTDRVELELLRNEQKQGHSLLLIGTHHDTPIIAAKLTVGHDAAEIEEPMILPDWAGMGFEEAVIAFAVHQLRQDSHRVIYTAGDPSYHRDLYLRMGFIKMTQLVTFVRAKNAVNI
jgi:ribosomal protein S18 acetylase RimI-like enzyme